MLLKPRARSAEAAADSVVYSTSGTVAVVGAGGGGLAAGGLAAGAEPGAAEPDGGAPPAAGPTGAAPAEPGTVPARGRAGRAGLADVTGWVAFLMVSDGGVDPSPSER